MKTTHDEVADGIHRFATFNPDAGIPFCQFLIEADEPLLFHTGQRQLFPSVKDAVGRVIDPATLRWIAFGHFEADECGSMNQWLATAPSAQVAHGGLGVMVSLADQADREPRALDDGEVLDLGGKRVRYLATPHVPHGWDAGVLYEETTNTLFCSDLFTALGDAPATSDDDLIAPAAAAEDLFGATAITPSTAPTIRRLAELGAENLALMHGPTFTGTTDASAEQLRGLAADYERRLGG